MKTHQLLLDNFYHSLQLHFMWSSCPLSNSKKIRISTSLPVQCCSMLVHQITTVKMTNYWLNFINIENSCCCNHAQMMNETNSVKQLWSFRNYSACPQKKSWLTVSSAWFYCYYNYLILYFKSTLIHKNVMLLNCKCSISDASDSEIRYESYNFTIFSIRYTMQFSIKLPKLWA